MLDKMINVTESRASIFETLSIGAYSIVFQNRCVSIEEVWVNNNESRSLLSKISLRELKEYYSSLASEAATGNPLYYALANLRALETTNKTSLGTFINLNWSETDTNYDYRGIIIVPPASESMVIEVVGKFYQPVLNEDTQKNYWTILHPEILIKAALYQMEIFSEKYDTAKNRLNALINEIMMLDMDIVTEEIQDIDTFGG